MSTCLFELIRYLLQFKISCLEPSFLFPFNIIHCIFYWLFYLVHLISGFDTIRTTKFFLCCLHSKGVCVFLVLEGHLINCWLINCCTKTNKRNLTYQVGHENTFIWGPGGHLNNIPIDQKFKSVSEIINQSHFNIFSRHYGLNNH